MIILDTNVISEPLRPVPDPAGNLISFADGATAAIAAAHGFAVATRNGRDFKGTGVELIDPWAAAR